MVETWAYERHPSAPGTPYPLGSQPVVSGTNFAVHAPRARRVRLVLPGVGTYELESRTGSIWHVEVRGIGPGQEYALEVDGVRVLDPYAKHVVGGLEGNTSRLRSYVADPAFDWSGDEPPRTPWDRTVVYEAHVRGLTMQHPDVPEEIRGTYAGLAHPAVLDRLADLGVTAVELLPVHHFVTEPTVADRGLVNYWGYNSVAYLAPHAPYAATDDPVSEFKEMVRALHARGLEVILDVVYNHTAEGGEGGPRIHLRALDDTGYYRHAQGHYFDVTGCGNTLRADSAPASALIIESLRYWVREMHVDGFRFDLTSALARTGRGRVDVARSVIETISRDPVLRGVKLIAEPWDASMDGYLVGGYPQGWSEWNDTFRDDVRDFWRGHGGGVAGIAMRLAGSSATFEPSGRPPQASVNFVTAHDGFTLRDLVSYDDKHNEANGEDNRDGHSGNRSWNCGVEGETDDVDVLGLRRRQAANLVATTLLAAGVPMLRAGDELGQTQHGNNNAYCHDSPLTWLPPIAEVGWEHLREVVARATALRAEHPVLRPTRFYTGAVSAENGREDLRWLHPDGRPWADGDWHDDGLRTIGMALDGASLDGLAAGEGASCAVVLLNSGDEPVDWMLPDGPWPWKYAVALDTADLGHDGAYDSGASVRVAAHSLVVLLEAS
ncbi:glycogen debranching protein GlgX [Mumia zhuanghuii]|uniref:Glycogen debranching protein GlgX n=2 Tax=Mumia TaxID=1546255 RepID=A0ABW1QRD6_9ACTN|nr:MULTISPECIES: glycogen debranching protein GlgX [Mumia]KAA1420359.1 glycogen debranching protein GlgX [Mumia zhuanghuii]